MRRLLLLTLLILLAAAPAHAGPLVGAIGLLGAWAAGSISATTAILGLAVSGASWLVSQFMQPKEKQRGVKTKMDTGGDNPPTFIIGEYATAGLLDYVNVWDGDSDLPNRYLTYVIVLSALPASGISNFVFVNNERCVVDWAHQDADGFSYVDQYEKYDNHYLRLKFYDGTQTGADPWLLDKFGADPDRPWLDDCRLDGCAYVIAICSYSNKGVWSSNPDFRWVIDGCPVYDPRKDSTVGGSGPQRWGDANTYTFSKNMKVLEYNTIRGFYYRGELVWGGGAEAYRLPLEYWFAAMNVCDEDVEKKNGNIIPRYEGGAEISFDDKPIERIDDFNKGCSGYTTEMGGVYKTWCGGPGLVVATFTDDDFLITEQMTTDRFQPLTAIYNTAYASYPEPNHQWEAKDAPRYQDADSLADDGQELAINLQVPVVSEANQIQRVQRAAVLDSRRQVTHQGQLPPEYFILEPMDRVAFISEDFGYHGDGKDFLLAGKDDLPNVNQQIQIRELNPDDTGWLKEYELDYRTGTFDVVKPGALDLPFTLASSQINSDVGKDKPAILTVWDWGSIDVDVANIRWEVRVHGTTDVIAEGRIRNIEEGSRKLVSHVLRFGKAYDVRLKPEPISRRDTTWTGWQSITLVTLDIPSAPTLTRVIQQADDGTQVFYLDMTCPAVTAEGTYVFRVVSDGVTRRHKADENECRIPVTSGKTFVVDVRFIASDGTRGAYSSTTSITISKKTGNVPAGGPLSIIASKKRLRVDWPDVDDDTYPDYRITYLWRNQTGTAPTPGITAPYKKTKAGFLVDDGLTSTSPFTYWSAHKDNSGNFGALSAGVSGTITGATEVSAFADLTGSIATGQIPAGTVTDAQLNQTAPATPASGPTVAQNPQTANGDGTVDISCKVTAPSLPTGAKLIEIAVDFNYGSTADLRTLHVNKNLVAHTPTLIAGKSYAFYYRGLSSAGVPSTSWSPATVFTPAGKTTAPSDPVWLSCGITYLTYVIMLATPTDADYLYTEYIFGSTTAPSTSATADGIFVIRTRIFVPLPLGEYIWVRHVNTSLKKSAWVAWENGTGTPQLVTPLYMDATQSIVLASLVAALINSIDTPQLVDSSVTIAKISNTTNLVANGTVGLSAGGVGTYAFLKNVSGSTIANGSNVAGSNLAITDTALATGATQSGTWQCMSRCTNNNASQFLRIS